MLSALPDLAEVRLGGLMPVGLTRATFERLGRARTAPDAIGGCGRTIDDILLKLNRSMWASRFSVLRTRFGLNGGDAFLTSGNYVHGGAGHWYVFHRNGRWEPQFNIGMNGVHPGQEPYLRVGLGANLTMASADPDRESGLRQLRSLFINLQWVARSSHRPLMLNALSVGRPIAESVGVQGPRAATGEAIASWLASVDVQDAAWVFVGRAFSLTVPEEAESLADFDELMFEITRTLDAWLPVWEAAMRGPDSEVLR